MTRNPVWVRCLVDDQEGCSHVLIKGHEVQMDWHVAESLEREGKVVRIDEPSKAVAVPEAPIREQRLVRK